MNYLEKLKELLKKNMSEKGFACWETLNESLPDIWGKASSSSGKYHLKDGNRQPNLDEHTYDMAFVADKLLRMFGQRRGSEQADIMFMAIALHDSLKYGPDGERYHTDGKHDKTAADMVRKNREVFLEFLSDAQYQILEDAVRYHSGRWSTNATSEFNFGDRHGFCFFVHVLDMLSTNDLVKLPAEEQDA